MANVDEAVGGVDGGIPTQAFPPLGNSLSDSASALHSALDLMSNSLNTGLASLDRPNVNIKDVKAILKEVFLSNQKAVLALQSHLKAVSDDRDLLANKVEATNVNVANNVASNAESLRIAQTSYVEKKG